MTVENQEKLSSLAGLGERFTSQYIEHMYQLGSKGLDAFLIICPCQMSTPTFMWCSLFSKREF